MVLFHVMVELTYLSTLYENCKVLPSYGIISRSYFDVSLSALDLLNFIYVMSLTMNVSFLHLYI